MNVLASKNVLRPGPSGIEALLAGALTAAMPLAFRILRRVKPVVTIGGYTLTSRYDHVREVFAADDVFGVVYGPKLDVIMGGEPFFLGMDDTPDYRRDVETMRSVVLPSDLPLLAADVESRAEAIVAASGGRVEVVDQLVRRVTFDFFASYLGIPEPVGGDLRVWATRLFEFQFADDGNDPSLRAEVDVIAPALRAHIDAVIERRRGEATRDDVLGRCLTRQALGEDGFEDRRIRTALMGFMVGGPPQPPMVVPQAMEQLLRRPAALELARKAALANDDDMLRRIVFEAMRFDPLAPGLPRIAGRDHTLGRGTKDEALIAAGSRVLAAFASAMRDPRRIRDPEVFDPDRPPTDYMHFGYGLHECFGRHINHATLHLMLKPLLKRANLHRADGRDGRLRKNGPFSERLVVVFDA